MKDYSHVTDVLSRMNVVAAHEVRRPAPLATPEDLDQVRFHPPERSKASCTLVAPVFVTVFSQSHFCFYISYVFLDVFILIAILICTRISNH